MSSVNPQPDEGEEVILSYIRLHTVDQIIKILEERMSGLVNKPPPQEGELRELAERLEVLLWNKMDIDAYADYKTLETRLEHIASIMHDDQKNNRSMSSA